MARFLPVSCLLVLGSLGKGYDLAVPRGALGKLKASPTEVFSYSYEQMVNCRDLQCEGSRENGPQGQHPGSTQCLCLGMCQGDPGQQEGMWHE